MLCWIANLNVLVYQRKYTKHRQLPYNDGRKRASHRRRFAVIPAQNIRGRIDQVGATQGRIDWLPF